MSNSSLSKTFALCQFRKLKVQKLCFLPPNIVLGLKKMSPKIILGQTKFWSGKNFGSEKKFCPKKNLGLKKNFGPEKNLGPGKVLGPKKI